ncbi:MAG: hypothetical protein HQK51_13795 [Oligoflexia bacterium]|nr:hypothetical protein [Oligoflexia bacterium]
MKFFRPTIIVPIILALFLVASIFVCSNYKIYLQSLVREAPKLNLNWQVGEQKTYDFKLNSQGKSKLNSLNDILTKRQNTPSSWIEFSVEFIGKMILTTTNFNEKNQTYTVRLTFKDVSIKGIFDHKSLINDFKASDFELSTIAFTIHQSGYVSNIFFPINFSTVARNQIRILLSHFNFYFPDKAQYKWGKQESLLTEKYNVGLEILHADSDERILSKKYLSIGGEESKYKVSGEAKIHLKAKTLAVSKVYAHKHSEVFLDRVLLSEEEDVTKIEETSSILISKQDLDQQIGQINTLLKATIASNFDSKQDIQDLTKQEWKKLINQISFEDLLKQVRESKKIDFASIKTLEAYINLKPETTQEMGKELQQLNENDEGFYLLAMTLSAAGTKVSQEELIQAIKTHLESNPKYTSRLIVYLGKSKDPSNESEEYLRNLADTDPREEISGMARTSIGILAGHIKETDRPRALKILNETSRHLSESNNLRDQDLLLRTIGNIGLEEQIDIIKPALLSTDLSIRYSATSALRFVNSEQAWNLLFEKGAKDDDEFLRSTAIESLRSTPPDPEKFNYLRKRLRQEKSVKVLKEIIIGIYYHSNQNNEAKKLLFDYKEKTGSTELATLIDNFQTDV